MKELEKEILEWVKRTITLLLFPYACLQDIIYNNPNIQEVLKDDRTEHCD
jgi:hypothetical protein